MTWDPKAYLTFENERTRPAAELLARIPQDQPNRVIDLGCGPGNSTALLAARWPDAMLEGLDNSAEMLAQAKASGVRANWIQSDIASWSPRARFDVVYANAAFQWVGNHETLLPKLISHVAPGGTVAFQVPRNFDEPSHTVLRALADEPRWRDPLKSAREWWSVHAPADYYAMLEPHTARIDIWETEYLQALDGEDAVYRWTSGTGARPFINALSGKDREDFIAEYKHRLAAAYPKRPTGRTLFPFQRLFCVAVK
jgi:trans-aconitate 2-methyltransferase